MLDKIANQKLFFISLIGIVVTSLILTTTFAYQSIRVNYSDGADSDLSISAGVLDVKYCRNDECVVPSESENNYNQINVDNLSFLPNYKTASYVEFVVDNTNSTDDVAYMISLTNLTYNNMFVSEAFKYTVVSVNDNGSLNEISTGNFSSLTGNSFELNLEDRIYRYIEKGKTEKVRIYLWLDENVDVQLDLSDNSERHFTGIVSVSSIFEGEIANPLLYRRLINSAKLASKNNDKIRTVYNDTFDLNNISGVSSVKDKMLALAEDDYGTSYVYRGAVKDNYVNFAGFTWRIVRINGDGSIRLILDGTLDKVCADYEKDSSGNCTNYAGTTSKFNDSGVNDNAYIGYMYGDFEGNSKSYDEAHENINDSLIKAVVDDFYQTYVKNFEENVADNLFCGDKSLADSSYLGYGNNDSFYSAYKRVTNNGEEISSKNSASPILKCAENAVDTYSRYTVNEININGNVSTNGSLTYPIALLSVDELVMAGAFSGGIDGPVANQNYYLYDAYKNGFAYKTWVTMTPVYLLSEGARGYDSFIDYSVNVSAINYNHVFGVRPVINLKSSLLWDSGDGTESNPYRVKLSD